MAFIPKKDVWFFGFGIMGNYHSYDWTLKVKWRVGEDGEASEYSIDLKTADRDPDKRWQTIDIRTLGEKPVKVTEGTKIHCLVKCAHDDGSYMRCYYGQYGSKSYYSVLPDQDYDFDTASSSLCEHGCTTSTWGQIPFILYC